MKEICLLMKYPGACSDTTAEVLYKQKCLYLLSRITNVSARYSYYLTVNRMVQEFRYLYCKSVFDRLKDIPYAVIKGAVLSNSIYGAPFYRLSGDIDILISPKNAKQVTEILNDNGFIQGRVSNEEIFIRSREELLYHKLYTHQLASFQKKTDYLLSPFVTFDVNFDISWGENSQKINVEDFLLHTEMTSIFDVTVNKLSPIYEFISMCMHHYKDMNSIYLLYRKGYSLYEFFDIYYYLINQKLNVDKLNEVVRYYNVEQYIYYCIYYANELFKDKRLEVYLDLLKSPEGIEIINCFGLNKEEKHTWKIPFLNRVLDDDFKKIFKEQLNDIDFKKIEINTKYMTGEQQFN